MLEESLATKNRIFLPRYTKCFVCGKTNPIGLDSTFSFHNGRIETQFTPLPPHCGYHSIVHGGILATLLDECMGWTGILSRPVLAKSVELTIRYKESALVHQPLLIWGELVSDRKRLLTARGGVENAEGILLCSGEGKYIILPPDEQRAVEEEAQWGDTLQQSYAQIQRLR